ncbi:MAG: type I methionyl aminopeptidase [Planctomycetota bacterium]|nr:type I methionyl aminopeptidase [Planctomycetota bacterium]
MRNKSAANRPQLPYLKSPRELAQMRRAGIINWGAHQLVSTLVTPGVTTLEIDNQVEKYFAERQAVPLFKGVPGKIPFPAVCCISVNEEVVHGIPRNRPLIVGDVVSVDTGCRFNGWCADSAVTYPVGQIDPDVQKLLDITKGTLDLAIRLIGEKSLWSEVAAEMATYVRDAGFSVVENFVGHGIGRDMHEEPQVPNFVSPAFRRTSDFRLEPGLVIAVEPMVNMGTKKVKGLSDHWTQATQDSRPSAHFEHTIAVTENGPWVLTAEPTAEELAKLA